MKIGDLRPIVKTHVRFALSERRKVPTSAGCYVLTAFDHTVLYVGLTNNLTRRFSEHCDTESKREPTPYGRAFWFFFETLDEKQINRHERGWINQYSAQYGSLPPLNKIASPVS